MYLATKFILVNLHMVMWKGMAKMVDFALAWEAFASVKTYEQHDAYPYPKKFVFSLSKIA